MYFCVSAVRLLRNKPLNSSLEVSSVADFRSILQLQGRNLAAFLSQKLCQTSISIKKASSMASNMEDLALPNETWSKESLELFNELNKLTEEGKGWTKVCSYTYASWHLDGSRSFLRPMEEKGKFLEYAFFCNPGLHSLRGVVQFGLYTKNLSGYVHGGAVSTVLDAAMGVCIEMSGMAVVTANLNTDFKRNIHLGSTVLVEATIDKVEGRKIFTSAVLKNVDDDVTYANSTALFVIPNKFRL